MRAAGLLALVLLTGCASVPAKYAPPSALLEDCPAPAVDVTTNKGIAEGLVLYAQVLKLCNIDKAALREWSKED